MAEHAGNNKTAVDPSSLLWQVACVISYSRHDLGLCPVFVAGRQFGARGIVEEWAGLADDASLEGCYLSASKSLNHILDKELINLTVWLISGVICFYFLTGNSFICWLTLVAWILWFLVLAQFTNKALLLDLCAIMSVSAFELHHRKADWNPFIGVGWIQRRRLRKASWVFCRIEESIRKKNVQVKMPSNKD